MKAVIYRRCGGPDVLELADVPDPVPGPDQVLIAVDYVSIEGGDLLHRRSTPLTAEYNIPGYQAMGRVLQTGRKVQSLSVGERVLAFHWSGSHAEKWCVEAQHVFPLPQGIDPAMASTVATTFGTASDALFEFGHLKAGETVFVQGGAGGVGLALIQLAARAGARVIASASGAERAARLLDFGADHVIDHRAPGFSAEVLALTGGRGCDMVCDLAGGATVPELMKCIRYRGRYIVVGSASGERASFGFNDLVRKALTCQGVLFGAEMGTARGRAVVRGLLADMAAGHLRMPVDRIFPLDQAAQAHEYAETAHPFGRVLLQVT
ncbi:zinc-binding alcohol dehydrogenase family protein [Falsigemmobacter intermedius]|uniref:Zinc-binding alcohol dehydrogenase family protein n=1 Tax=Falsigemmobacter intermedius TaxID=1553448 RepID=A0A3S3U164_9RHOB|nr:zinc-binding dehydrogenase [Falsigemmobacter intermedius]RWY37664.1 zinc-binding alcohol dehydrogenase family protein [Falsigemmobacter intermedius]